VLKILKREKLVVIEDSTAVGWPPLNFRMSHPVNTVFS
jgi:hypothetical protein